MITFETVTKQFGDGSYALKEVSFAVEPGELVVITGPSGSGKTTLMKLLTREYVPTSGEIVFFETPLSSIKSNQVYKHRRQIGVVFQDYKLLPEYNVWENIALPLLIVGKSMDEIESRVTDLLKLVNLTEKAYLFPTQLSGGEAQRVSIARALATGPEVIFADEPTGNLDPETSLSIAKLLKTINELGTTILFATHDLGVLKALADERHLHIVKGEITKDTKQGKAPKSNKKPSLKTEPEGEAAAKADETNNKAPKSNEQPKPAVEKPKKPGFKLNLPKFGLPKKKSASQADEHSAAEEEPEPKSVKVENLE